MSRTSGTITSDVAESVRPTRVRYGVLAFAGALSMITYLDRACIASAAPSIVRDLHLESIADLKWVFFAFALAYALFQVPSGWLGDVFGPRKVLIWIVLWWSLFTVLTGMVGLSLGGLVMGLAFLIVVQLLFGVGDAGGFPNITRALHNWFPRQERGFAQGVMWMSGRLMAGLTPLIWMVLVEGIAKSGTAEVRSPAARLLPPLLPWRAVFWLFGLVGVAWVIGFAWWFRNRPEEKAGVNAAELAWIRSGQERPAARHGGVPWRRLLGDRNLWALCMMYGLQSYGWYFYITYLPSFLERRFHVPADSLCGAIYKGGPLLLGAVGCLLGGLLTDRFVRRTGNLRWGRRLFGVIGHTLTCLCFLACRYAPSAFWFFLAISFAGFSTDLGMAAGWSSCQDIGRRYAGIVAGFMNTCGNLGGALAGWSTGFVVQQYLGASAVASGVAANSFSAPQKEAAIYPADQLNFLIFATAYAIGVLCWLRIDATRAVAAEENDGP